MNDTVENPRVTAARATIKKWMAQGVVGQKAMFRLATSHGLTKDEADALVAEMKKA